MQSDYKKYLIQCNTIKYYLHVKNTLDENQCQIKLLNNYDGTFDFIIQCHGEYIKQLELVNIHCIEDKPIVYDL
jgi:hypothetical protein